MESTFNCHFKFSGNIDYSIEEKRTSCILYDLNNKLRYCKIALNDSSLEFFYDVNRITSNANDSIKKIDDVLKNTITTEIPKNQPIICESSAKQSAAIHQIINLNRASFEIRFQAQKLWPNKIRNLQEGDRIICIKKGENLIGCVSLQQMFPIDPSSSLAQEINGQKVHLLEMAIKPEYFGQGYGRKIFNEVCNSTIKEGALVYLVDMAKVGIGDALYGGKQTRELFEVHHILKGQRGEYLLKEKTKNKTDINYLKINEDELYIIWKALESSEGMAHLINYLNAHPEDKKHITTDMIKCCSQIITIYENQKSELDKYKNLLENLLKLLGLEVDQ